MLTLKRITLYSFLIKFEKDNIPWPLSGTYPHVVSGSATWSPTLPTVAVLMRAYRNPLSSFFRAIEDGDDCLESFFRAIEDGDDCLESLSYDSPSFREEIVYERRAMMDTMVDIWRERNNSNKCRAEIRKKLEADNVKVNSWFSPKCLTLTMYVFSSCCEALELRMSEVLEEYERRCRERMDHR